MRNLSLSAVLVGLSALCVADELAFGVHGTPWGESGPLPHWDVVYHQDVANHPTMATIYGGSVHYRPTYFVVPEGTQHGYTRTSVRPDLSFAGKFDHLRFAHGSTGTYYNTSGAWYADSYTPASGGGQGGN